MRAESGFSLIELTVASALLMVVMASVFQALNPAHGVFQTEPERADVQQRLRVAISVLADAIGHAGAGPAYGVAAGPLNTSIAAVLPYRIGRRNADPAGTFRSDAITVLKVEDGAAHTSLAQPLTAQSGVAVINLDAGCPAGDLSCGFAVADTVLVLGDAGRFDLFSVTAVQGPALTLQHNTRDSAFVYPAGAPIVAASSRTFFMKPDAATDQLQLVRYDGDGGADIPVVDHLVGLSFRYRVEPEPPRALKLPAEPKGPWSSYGPHAPDLSAQPTSFAPGENCVFQLDAASHPAPRLAVLGTALVDLTPAQMTDGPWCTDATDGNRFDADLLRIRAVSVTVRVEASAASLRGEAGPLFTRPGLGRAASRIVPDVEQTIEIAPINLDPGR